MPVISAFRTRRQESSLSYIVRSFLKNLTKGKWESNRKEERKGKRERTGEDSEGI